MDDANTKFCGFKSLVGLSIAVFFNLSGHLPASPVNINSLEAQIFTADENDLSRLEKDVAKLLQIQPSSAEANYFMAMVSIRKFLSDPSQIHLAKQSIELARQALELAPSADVGYVALCFVLDHMGESQKAFQQLSAMENKPGLNKTWRHYYALAWIQTSLDYESSVIFDNLKKAADLIEPTNRPILSDLIISNILASESPGRRSKSLRVWVQRVETEENHVALAKALAEENKNLESMQQFSKIRALYPSSYQGYFGEGYHLLHSFHRYREAIETLKSANLLAKNANEKSMIQTHLALAFLHNNQTTLAADTMIESLRGAKEQQAALSYMIPLFRKSMKPKESYALLTRLSQEMPGISLVHGFMGETLSEDMKDHQGAIRAYGNAIVLEPTRSEYYNGRGLAFFSLRHWGSALMNFKAATQVNPSDASARYNAACALVKLGKKEEALDELRVAFTQDKKLRALAQADSDLKDLRNSKEFELLVSDKFEKDNETENSIAH
jgi:tetratricopeptide (TPR) repeat protein